VAIIFGALGKRKGNTENRGSAIAGMVMGIVMTSINCCFGILIMGVIMAVLSHAPQR
jgi:hypothetical protein